MASAKLLMGGAAATAAIGVRIARSLYGRWRVLPESDRRRIEPLAEDLKARALEVRGAPDRERAGEDLRAANESFAATLVETAEADPEVGEDEVRELREDLRRELARLATPVRAPADDPPAYDGTEIKASRTRRRQASPPG